MEPVSFSTTPPTLEKNSPVASKTLPELHKHLQTAIVEQKQQITELENKKSKLESGATYFVHNHSNKITAAVMLIGIGLLTTAAIMYSSSTSSASFESFLSDYYNITLSDYYKLTDGYNSSSWERAERIYSQYLTDAAGQNQTQLSSLWGTFASGVAATIGSIPLPQIILKSVKLVTGLDLPKELDELEDASSASNDQLKEIEQMREIGAKVTKFHRAYNQHQNGQATDEKLADRYDQFLEAVQAHPEYIQPICKILLESQLKANQDSKDDEQLPNIAETLKNFFTSETSAFLDKKQKMHFEKISL